MPFCMLNYTNSCSIVLFIVTRYFTHAPLLLYVMLVVGGSILMQPLNRGVNVNKTCCLFIPNIAFIHSKHPGAEEVQCTFEHFRIVHLAISFLL